MMNSQTLQERYDRLKDWERAFVKAVAFSGADNYAATKIIKSFEEHTGNEYIDFYGGLILGDIIPD